MNQTYHSHQSIKPEQMKKLLSLLSVLLLAVAGINAQSPAPGILNYQGVARNSVGNVLVNKNITLRLTIHDGSAAGPVVYSETRPVTTNPFGLFNVQLGSTGATVVSGSIAGVPWGVGLKYIQVEIDPNGGSAFINIGTAQLASVPYSLYSSLSNDLVLPFNKTQADAGTLFRITNSGTGSGSTALEGVTNSQAGNAFAVIGTVSHSAPGGFSAGVRGINNGVGGLGIGVYGSQNGSGWGVYGTTPGGIGVNGVTNTGVGINGSSTSGTAGVFSTTSGDGIRATTGGTVGKFGVIGIATADGTGVAGNSGSGIAVLGVSGTGPSGVFQNFTPANTTTTLSALNQGGSGDAFTSTTSGTGRAGLFQNTNNTNTQHVLAINNAGGSGHAVNATTSGTGSAGLFNINNTTSAATALQATTTGTGNAVSGTRSATTGTAAAVQGTSASTDGNAVAVQGVISSSAPGGFSAGVRGINNGTGGLGIGVWGSQAGSGWGVYGTANGGIGVNGSANSGIGVNGTSNTGTGGRFTTTSGLAIHTTGGVRLQGIGEAANRVLTSDAAGNATWQALGGGVGIGGSGTLNFVSKWTPDGVNLGNSLLFDDGSSVGLGTTTPTHRFNVVHGGSTGIGITSTSGFSVLDINAASGDAAIRFGNAGVNQWNLRNQPGTDNLQIFELGGGGERMHIENATGNISIGGSVPTHRLHVFHGGSTGIKIESAASFSVLDIDAASGDAAIRFGNAGTNQWNLRNQPGTDNLQIFELGGGGERFVIENGTGNISIGAGSTPTYKLDILHGGSTGIRNKSTSSYSAFDIDGATGDAAIRFANNGVNQWNLRNQPGTDNLQIFELGGGGERFVIENGTGNISIGAGSAPTYKLDILHGGSTGIRNKSTSSYSAFDIDGATGDAAIRLANNGVNQWNIRNQPGTDNLQIFELGGGGERFVIENSTGNISIGAGSTPAYKLDILHGGSTGIRNKSTSSYSAFDLDGATGDAAIRLYNNGVTSWNIRNQPGTDNLQIFELGSGERMRIENTTGNVYIAQDLDIGGNISKGSGTFKIDHPQDPENKYLIHSFVESPDMMNIYNGNIVTDASGKAVVSLPGYFESLNMEYRYQLTVIGSFAQAIISKKVNKNQFEIATSLPNIEVSWQVTGIRKDAYANERRIVPEVEKDAKDKGKYLHPSAFNQPASKGINYTKNQELESGSLAPVKLPVAKPLPAAALSGGSLDPTPVNTNPVKVEDKGGSIEEIPIQKPSKKIENKGGSIEEQPARKLAPAPAAEKGGSVGDTPVSNKKIEGTKGE
jgi:hypothetical protein